MEEEKNIYDNATYEDRRNWLMKKAVETYGPKMQIVIAIEELSELQKALCKYLREGHGLPAIAEEIADVEIMLDQIELIFGLRNEIEKQRVFKEERLYRRINEDIERSFKDYMDCVCKVPWPAGDS